ncbi:MAG: cytochrome c oxidase subunit 3 [Algoriphagus sp.]|nr:cytochrome c oxidase subunit 3 [Algoriphagus sp.]MDP4748409.1 cytochrome c oxidase subunit 3 [Algoriphagus sp.]MDP4838864.1 cytochrome c oxidase subunit 3 [Algoriphagus sp.]MDP4904493.1 cytochrome c oxidase subunit 3 [Algoriphagus sp.]MDP4957182.1 cytochrome c oxidase subunit 3 [Algoriphagus sp.]
MRQALPPKTWLQRLENLHPYEMLLYLAMVGSGLIFLFLALAFLFSGRQYLQGLNEQMPFAFSVSTFLLVLSGYTAVKMRLHYQEENSVKLYRSLQMTFGLGILFMGFQVLGWIELTDKGINFTGLPSGSFLYVLSGIHVIHLFGAMVFAVILLRELRKIEQDAIRKLVWTKNPFEKLRIRLFTVYWQFMDAIWLVLFLLFVLSF